MRGLVPKFLMLICLLHINYRPFDPCERVLTVRFSEQIMSADKYPSIFSRQINQINARALVGQSAVGYCAGKPTEKSRVF